LINFFAFSISFSPFIISTLESCIAYLRDEIGLDAVEDAVYLEAHDCNQLNLPQQVKECLCKAIDKLIHSDGVDYSSETDLGAVD
jgi:hypothetical protein